MAALFLGLAFLAGGCGKPSPKTDAAKSTETGGGPVKPASVASSGLPNGMRVLFSPKDSGGKDLARAKLMGVGAQGKIIIIEDSDQRKAMYWYSADGDLLRTWDSLVYGPNKYTFFFPFNLAVDGSGNIYLCDQGFYWVNKFDPEGAFIKTVAGRSVPESGIMTPGNVNLDKDGKVYVTQGESTKIHRYLPDGTPDGIVETALGEQPSHKGIADVAVDGDGNFHVLSSDADMLLSFDREGKFLRAWKTNASFSVECGAGGSIYLAGGYGIQKYDSGGKLLAEWKTGDDAPAFSVCSIGVDPKGGLLILDQVMDFSTTTFKPSRVLHVE